MPTLRHLAFASLVAATFVAAAEIGARAYDVVRPDLRRPLRALDPLAVQIEPVGDRGYRQRPGAVIEYASGAVARSNALGFRGPVVALAKPSGHFRIVLLGGSTTHGWDVNDDQTLDAHMRAELAARFPDQVFEVVNLAFDGYDSYQDWERFRTDGLRLEPDLVVVTSGINDVKHARLTGLTDADPRTLEWERVLVRLRLERERGGPDLWTRAKHESYLLRSIGWFRQRQRRGGGGAAGESSAERRPARVHDDALDYYERNLERIADLALSREMAVLFVSPPSSLRSKYAPTDRSSRPYWLDDAATTADYRDRLAARMRAVADSLSAARFAVAYAAPAVPDSGFIDDAHLNPVGNRVLARAIVDAARPLIDATRRQARPHLARAGTEPGAAARGAAARRPVSQLHASR